MKKTNRVGKYKYLIAMILCIFIYAFSGCNNSLSKNDIADTYYAEIGKYYILPEIIATVSGKAVEVSAQVYDQKNALVEVKNNSFVPKKLGDFKIVFTADDFKKEAKLIVQDNTAPGVNMLMQNSYYFVGQEISIPKAIVIENSENPVSVEYIVSGPEGSPVKLNERKFTPAKVGTYIISINGTDAASNKTKRDYSIMVVNENEFPISIANSEGISSDWNSLDRWIPADGGILTFGEYFSRNAYKMESNKKWDKLMFNKPLLNDWTGFKKIILSMYAEKDTVLGISLTNTAGTKNTGWEKFFIKGGMWNDIEISLADKDKGILADLGFISISNNDYMEAATYYIEQIKISKSKMIIDDTNLPQNIIYRATINGSTTDWLSGNKLIPADGGMLTFGSFFAKNSYKMESSKIWDKLVLNKPTLKNWTGYKRLILTMYSAKDVVLGVRITNLNQSKNSEWEKIFIKGGQWNEVEVSLNTIDPAILAGVGGIQISNNDYIKTATYYLSEIKLSKEADPTINPNTVYKASINGSTFEWNSTNKLLAPDGGALTYGSFFAKYSYKMESIKTWDKLVLNKPVLKNWLVYKRLILTMYSSKDVILGVRITNLNQSKNSQWEKIFIKGGQWNEVEVSLDTIDTAILAEVGGIQISNNDYVKTATYYLYEIKLSKTANPNINPDTVYKASIIGSTSDWNSVNKLIPADGGILTFGSFFTKNSFKMESAKAWDKLVLNKPVLKNWIGYKRLILTMYSETDEILGVRLTNINQNKNTEWEKIFIKGGKWNEVEVSLANIDTTILSAIGGIQISNNDYTITARYYLSEIKLSKVSDPNIDPNTVYKASINGSTSEWNSTNKLIPADGGILTFGSYFDKIAYKMDSTIKWDKLILNKPALNNWTGYKRLIFTMYSETDEILGVRLTNINQDKNTQWEKIFIKGGQWNEISVSLANIDTTILSAIGGIQISNNDYTETATYYLSEIKLSKEMDPDIDPNTVYKASINGSTSEWNSENKLIPSDGGILTFGSYFDKLAFKMDSTKKWDKLILNKPVLNNWTGYEKMIVSIYAETDIYLGFRLFNMELNKSTPWEKIFLLGGQWNEVEISLVNIDPAIITGIGGIHISNNDYQEIVTYYLSTIYLK